MNPHRHAYNLLVPAVLAGARVAALFNGKIRRTIAVRKGIRRRWIEACGAMDRGRPVVWFHVSSAGEYLQAAAVIDRIVSGTADRPAVAVTFFSPSGYDYCMKHDARRNPGISFVEYLPFDTPGGARFCLD